MATLATASSAPASASELEATGVFTRVEKSRDLWMDLGSERLRVNLDAFGSRRNFVCETLLDGTGVRPPKVFGVVNGSHLKVAAEFYTADRRENHGFVEFFTPTYRLSVTAAYAVPDVLVGTLHPGYPVEGELEVTQMHEPEFPLVLDFIRTLEGKNATGEERVFKARGRIREYGDGFASDALHLKLHGPAFGGLHLAMLKGEIVPSRHGLYLVTPSGYRVRLMRGRHLTPAFRALALPFLDSRLLYSKIPIYGLWDARKPEEVRVFLTR